MGAIVLFVFILFSSLILFLLFMYFTKRGREFGEKIRKNPYFYSPRGATEEISEQNRTIIRRLVHIEERMEELEKMVGELLEAAKNNDVKDGVI